MFAYLVTGGTGDRRPTNLLEYTIFLHTLWCWYCILVCLLQFCLQYISRLKQLHSMSGDSGQMVFSSVKVIGYPPGI